MLKLWRWLFAGRERLGIASSVRNVKRRFGSAKWYYAVRFRVTGAPVEALFTVGEITRAQRRAARNPEDLR